MDMLRRPGGLQHVARILGIACAIVGMELDVLSGPLPLECFPQILCGLFLPGPIHKPQALNASYPSLEATNTDWFDPGADDPDDSSPRLFGAVWPSAIIIARLRTRVSPLPRILSVSQQHTPDAPPPVHADWTASRVDRFIDMPLQLCRLRC